MSTRARIAQARASEAVARVVLGAMAASVVALALFVLGYIVYHGIGAIDLTFLTEVPRSQGREGGIFPAIVGTVLVTLATAALTLPIGVLAGIYLAEYAPRNYATRAIRLAITNMAGVPSIVYGLLALGLFVYQFDLGQSVLSAGLTLALLILPVVIVATRESIRASLLGRPAREVQYDGARLRLRRRVAQVRLEHSARDHGLDQRARQKRTPCAQADLHGSRRLVLDIDDRVVAPVVDIARGLGPRHGQRPHLLDRRAARARGGERVLLQHQPVGLDRLGVLLLDALVLAHHRGRTTHLRTSEIPVDAGETATSRNFMAR